MPYGGALRGGEFKNAHRMKYRPSNIFVCEKTNSIFFSSLESKYGHFVFACLRHHSNLTIMAANCLTWQLCSHSGSHLRVVVGKVFGKNIDFSIDYT